MGGKQKLSPREIKACEAYLRGMSLREALLYAGYSPNYCERNPHLFNWLKRREVTKYVRMRQQQIAEAENLDKAELVKYAREILKDFDPRDRSRALELLMRMGLPLDTDKLTAKEATGGITINFGEAKKDNT